MELVLAVTLLDGRGNVRCIRLERRWAPIWIMARRERRVEQKI